MRSIFKSKSILEFLIEVLLIGLGVFLGLLVNQWHDDREHREQADASLRYFHEEIVANKQAIEKGRTYHTDLSREVGAFLHADGAKTMQSFQSAVHLRGVEPVEFEHTSWDLALATQSFSYLPPTLAYAISAVYTRQQAFQNLENGFLQSALSPLALGASDITGLAMSMDLYLHDVNIQEPALVTLYDQLLPQIEAAMPKQ